MKNNHSQQNNFSLRNVILALIIFFLGYLAHGQLQTLRGQVPQKGMNLFWKVWTTLEKKYPFEEPTDDTKIYGAIKGLVNSYDDDYSRFLPPSETKFFNQTIEGEFGGIGAEIGIRDGYLTVISPLKDSPAEKAGLRAGDIITHVDDIDISGETLDNAIGYIRGEIGSNVILSIIRPEEEDPLEIRIQRDNVEIPVIETEVKGDTFVMHLYNFNHDSEKKFTDALQRFVASGKKQLLIDLRNNPGGYLRSSIDIASHFLEQGKVIVREEHGDGDDDETIYRSTKAEPFVSQDDVAIVVLVNAGSASASEIIAGALQDHKRAIIAGENSYGKGSVQELIDLPEETSLKITIARWLTPNGNYISGNGIQPDVYIPQIESDNKVDAQLEKALQVFNTDI